MQQKMQELSGLIGLEIHVYLVTKEKLFCRCRAVREKGTKPNNFICPVCTGQPGAKPMLPNKTAVEKAVQVGLMLNCKINERMIWQRKHYSWPDLPKGYQNTLSGAKAFPVGEHGSFYGIRIREMHLEEDPAAWNPETGEIDYNRSGFPLIEIVTEPDFSTAEEVAAWLEKLLHNLQYLKAVVADAGIKADVNVNLLEPKKTERVEIKNVNSVENIKAAIEYEFERQASEGSVRETRRFDFAKGKTTKMREKEGAEDYRFISDPDLPDLILDKKFVDEMKKKIPESPEEKLEKLVKKYKIGKEDAGVLAKNLDVVEFFEKVAEKVNDTKFVLRWTTVELLRLLNHNKTKLDAIEIKTEHFTELLKMMKDGKITELQGKEILKKFYPTSFSPHSESFGKRISGENELEDFCKVVIMEETEAVEKYKNGDEKVLNYLIGQVMKKTSKRADFRVVRDVMEKMLK
jgi:aspartyl-tRNA(Asn)/glutamyl-tRNA(Gln) amidotransferase subunit B